jgi:hypothetical protein
MSTKCLPLTNTWVFYFEEKPNLLKPPATGRNPLSASLPLFLNSSVLGKFDTVQGFWSYWNNINLAKLPVGSQIKLFKAEVSPQPEAPSNGQGGKWVIAFDRNNAQNIAQIWLLCVLALIGEQFEENYVVGTVLSIGGRNTISVFTKSHHRKCIDSTEMDLCRLLSIPRERMRYQRHCKDIKPMKSFNIKITKSVDLTHPTESLSSSPNNPASCSPSISPSPSFMGEAPLYINLNLISGKTEKGILSIKKIPQTSSKSLPAPTLRMSKSTDLVNFRIWKDNLPKLHRRRGRRTFCNKISEIKEETKITIQNPTEITEENPPESTAENQIEITEENPPEITAENQIDITEENPTEFSDKKQTPIIKKSALIQHTLYKPQINSSRFLGFRYLGWMAFLLGITLILGTYVTILFDLDVNYKSEIS